jgi:hypothetical protein
LWLVSIVVEIARAQSVHSQPQEGGDRAEVASSQGARAADEPSAVLSAEEWREVDASVARALEWLSAQQESDGAFPTRDVGQPGITSLCVLAFLAHGHMPGEGQYGTGLERAVDFVLRCQKKSGLVSLLGPDDAKLTRFVAHTIGETATYNHGIASLMLSESYGMSAAPRADRLQEAIAKSVDVTLQMQRFPKDDPADRGGWRYLDDAGYTDSDLSATGWQLMFLRSARNAGFDVPSEPIDDAVGYVRRCFDPRVGAFTYSASQPDRSRGMAGAGILALGHAGYHRSAESRQAGDWLLRQSYDNYNPPTSSRDRYHYGLFNCCQGMYQLGGEHWESFFPRAAKTLLSNQDRDGSWPAEGYFQDAMFGNAYTTALAVLSLGAANQLLPIFQR